MSEITGREPRLSRSTQTGGNRLLPRRLANLLNSVNPDSVSLDAVAEALKSDDFFVRYNAGKLLGRRADRSARLLCETTLASGGPLARASVARNLHGFSWFTAENLYRQALHDEDSRVREAAVYALCDTAELNAYHLLAQHLPGEVDDVLDAAAVGLRDRQDVAVVSALAAVLQARDPEVRIKGLEALAASDSPEALPVVRSALTQDGSMQVRYAATLSFLELGHEACLDELAQIIEGASSVMRLYLLQGLFHGANYIGLKVSESAHAAALFTTLRETLGDDLPDTRIAAIWPLAWWWRNEQSRETLLQAYRDETHSKVKSELLRISVKLMTEAGEIILQEARAGEDAALRQQAEQIAAHRDKVGVILDYDPLADAGRGLAHPSTGR